MRKTLLLLIIIFGGLLYLAETSGEVNIISGAPPFGASEEEAPTEQGLDWLISWERPDVSVKVALQAGHYRNSEFPDELENLRNNTGAEAGGYKEAEVNLKIAELTAEILKEQGIETEILPATVPPSYFSDAFVAIHADGSEDSAKRGYKIAGPWRDFSGSGDELVSALIGSYYDATGFDWDPEITENMRGYYAFNWWRFEHSIHPMTTAAIVETGFLTNYYDRQVLTQNPEIPARAIAEGIMKYLKSQELI